MARSKACGVQAIVSGYREGISLRQLGILHGVSHETIRKLLVGAGIGRLDGGGAIVALKNIRARAKSTEEAQERRERRRQRFWGMTCAEFDAHVAEHGDRNSPGSPMYAYINQRNKAASRGLEWRFTFKTWWKVWVDSGKWESRGRHRDEFVMARYGDGDVPYSPETVYICTSTENLKDGFVSLPYNSRRPACR